MARLEKLFLTIGAMKAGTSWLYMHLRDHPDLDTPAVKEIHFFEHRRYGTYLTTEDRQNELRDYVRWLDLSKGTGRLRKDLDWFGRYFRREIDTQWFCDLFSRRSGTYAANYSNLLSLMSEADWKEIGRFSEVTRVVYLLREPISRLWSHVNFHAAVNGWTLRASELSTSDWRHFAQSNDLLRQGSYAENISRVRSAIGSDALKVVLFEDIKLDPLGLLSAVEQHLEVRSRSYDLEHLREVHNPSPNFEQDMPKNFIEAAKALVGDEPDRLARLGIDPGSKW